MRYATTYLVILATLLLTGACTGNFREINDDRTGIGDDDLAADYNGLGYRLGIVQQGVYFNYDYGKGRNWPFQLIQNLNADLFAGFMHDPKPLLGGSNNSDYNLQDGWNSAMWQFTYSYILPEIHRIEQTAPQVMPPFEAVALILKVTIMQRVTDFYGPAIYTRFGDPGHDYRPDSQQELYDRFFTDLDRALAILSAHLQENPGACELAPFDMLLDGEYASWIRMANSLRMRLAVRIASVDPDRARDEFRKATEDPGGVIELNTQIAAVAISDTYTNPLGEINRNWSEAVMNASMESVLKGYEDPRLEKFFEPSSDNVTPDGIEIPIRGEYHGIRQGTCFSHAFYASFSRLRIDPTTSPVLLSAAEVWFLRSEAALRGWTMEDAGTCYRTGVERSFEQWNAGQADTYLESDRTAADYADPLDPSNDIAARCHVCPRWEEEADRETKLEKILTQKWIALFPEGCEAWAEQRRTGYPRLLPPRYNHSKGGCIDTHLLIRRLNYPATLSTAEPQRYAQLVQLLGGEDHAGTRLWWDTGENFPASDR